MTAFAAFWTPEAVTLAIDSMFNTRGHGDNSAGSKIVVGKAAFAAVHGLTFRTEVDFDLLKLIASVFGNNRDPRALVDELDRVMQSAAHDLIESPKSVIKSWLEATLKKAYLA